MAMPCKASYCALGLLVGENDSASGFSAQGAGTTMFALIDLMALEFL